MELLIILEMAQIFVVKYIDNDSEMCYPTESVSGSSQLKVEGIGAKYELKHCQVQNYSLHEDLGQVDYLFCDKTGTLTQNELVFNKWASQGTCNPETVSANEYPPAFKDLLRCICLCHDVLLIMLQDPSGEDIEQMSGASQDELCLLEMVDDKNLARLVSRDATSVKINVLGETETYDYMRVLDFTSERKMMSVVMKNRETGVIRVFSKGASDAMQPRLAS